MEKKVEIRDVYKSRIYCIDKQFIIYFCENILDIFNI